MKDIGKIVCVGRNYAAHAAELNNPIPTEPLLFIKPATSLSSLAQLRIPTHLGACHHELEIAVQVSQRLHRVDVATATQSISRATLALDLTLRDVQERLKAQGQPWERAKAFDGACVLASWQAIDDLTDVQHSKFQLWRNGVMQQDGEATAMLNPIANLVAHISHVFTLLPGDVVLTGTPAGVGPLAVDDVLELHWQLANRTFKWQATVQAND